jgi:septum formation protein
MLLLASASPARQRLLKQAAIPHRVRVSGVDEDSFEDGNPRSLVQRLAEAKARAVLEAELREEGLEDVSAVIGCDSVLEFDGEIFGKPHSEREARKRWERMAGCWGDLHTGHCLLPCHVLGGVETDRIHGLKP